MYHMGRLKTGGKPKGVEFQATYELDGQTRSAFARTERKALEMVPQNGAIVEVRPIKYQGYYWDENGKQKWVTGSSEEEVLAKCGGAAAPRRGLNRTVTVGDNAGTLTGYGRRYLAGQLRDRKIEQSTYNNELSFIENHLAKPYAPGVLPLGAVPLQSVTLEAMQALINAKTAEWNATKQGGATVVKLHSLLRKLWNAVCEDPQWADVVKPISFNGRRSRFAVTYDEMLNERKDDKPLSDAELARIVEACADEYDRAIVGLTLCGLRPPGEVLGVKWATIDEGKREMKVLHQVRCEKQTDGSYKVVVKDRTKTGIKDPRRKTAIPITRQAWDLIQGTRELGSEFVVPSPRDNGPMHPDTASKRWKALLERAGVEHRRLYITRATFTQKLVKEGADIKTIQHLGGWTNAQTPIEAYVRFDTERTRKVLEQMNILVSATATHEELVDAVEAAPIEVKLRILTLLTTQPLAAR
jgi:integrase